MTRQIGPARLSTTVTEIQARRIAKRHSIRQKGCVSSEDPDLLPHCIGPKLGPFSISHPEIKFIDYISDPAEAAHSHVFEVEIEGSRYALKVVSSSC